MRLDERWNVGWLLTLVLAWLVTAAGQEAHADSPGDYYSLHRETQGIFFRGEDGAYYTEYRSGFQGTWDLTDPKVLCGNEVGPCDVEVKTMVVSVHDRLVFRFKVFVPPGMNRLQIMLYLYKNAETATVSRFGQPPTGDYSGYQYTDFPIDSDQGGTIAELTAADYLTRNSGGHTTVAQDYFPEVGDGGWLFVKVFALDGLEPMETRYFAQLDVASYLSWYLGVDWETFNASEYGTDTPTCVDQDGDTFGSNCTAGPDCDDHDPDIHPESTEICGNDKDDDCDALTDEGCGCTDQDGDTFGDGCAAGPDCDDHDPDIHPEAAETCGNDKDDDCDALTDEGCDVCTDGEKRECYDGPPVTEDVGLCQGGFQTCTAGAWGTCDGQVLPAPEEDCSDGFDNDCDGHRDGVDLDCGPCSNGENSPCYEGPVGTVGVGSCREGRSLCMLGYYLSCQDQVLPQTEDCNDEIDSDCDGLTDADDAADCDPCTAGDVRSCYDGPIGTEGEGICQAGTQPCLDGAWADCEGQQLPDGQEVCNDSFDNDCDGTTNYDDPDCSLCSIGDVRPCYEGPDGTAEVGSCLVGTDTCGPTGWAGCVGQVLPVAEVCGDGEDNDCDGKSDYDDVTDCQADDEKPEGNGACATPSGNAPSPCGALFLLVVLAGACLRRGRGTIITK
ncbi:MAG TPA: putative metal-binding motif-containing protein [Myxococcota bacterium]|nr:putative metal-binding motif-containing protein [Myxococcota bacterium]